MSKQSWIYNEQGQQISLQQAFPFLLENGHMVSLVGGGGKTTLMYTLGQFAAGKGRKTLVMTTTHIKRPSEQMMADSVSKAAILWKNGQIAVIGEPAEQEKLTMPQNALFHACEEQADLVLIEADGSKRLPVKVPAEKEPVILPKTDTVIGVFGMTALDGTLVDNCFRLELAKKFLQVPENHIITEVDVSKILTSEQGTRKAVEDREYYIVLNQCDTAIHIERAVRIGELIRNQISTQTRTQEHTHIVFTRLQTD